MTGFAASLTFV